MLTGAIDARVQHFKVPCNHGQKIVEIMRDASSELAHRLHLLRVPQLFFHFLSAGQVANEAGEDSSAARAGLAHGKLHRKSRAIPSKAGHHAAIADDSRFSSLQIVTEIAVMRLPIGRRHQHFDIATHHLSFRIAE